MIPALVDISVTMMLMIFALVGIMVIYGLIAVICFVVARATNTSHTARAWIRNSEKRFSKVLANTNESFYSTHTEHLIHNLCAICLVEFTTNCKIRKLACAHAFHKDCIDTWVRSKILHVPRCPICNLELIDEKPPRNFFVSTEMQEDMSSEMDLVSSR
eukprot:TRINITY_DN3011_c0_g4_i1.p1 TRINITY_DN3011_c0_g4~~TRINITY_DN3011_c0_g4_i1.p1  ORF type:complete len:159 (+),score=21.59 TRINITY_DN3011_c0_g4_i1:684-1160(+)